MIRAALVVLCALVAPLRALAGAPPAAPAPVRINAIETARGYSKRCFKPGRDSGFFLQALGRFTQMAVKDFVESEKDAQISIYFQLICEEPRSNTYVIFVKSDATDSYWFYGFKVDSLDEDVVSLTQFVRSKNPLRVCQELDLKLQLAEEREVGIPIEDSSPPPPPPPKPAPKAAPKPAPKTRLVPLAVPPRNSRGGQQELTEADRRREDALLSTPKRDEYEPYVHKSVTPIVSQPETSFTMGHYKNHRNQQSDLTLDDATEAAHRGELEEVDESMMEEEEEIEEEITIEPVAPKRAPAAPADQNGRFNAFVKSMGKDKANNWKNVAKSGSSGTSIAAALKKSKKSPEPGAANERMLSEDAQGRLHLTPLDPSILRDLDA